MFTSENQIALFVNPVETDPVEPARNARDATELPGEILEWIECNSEHTCPPAPQLEHLATISHNLLASMIERDVQSWRLERFIGTIAIMAVAAVGAIFAWISTSQNLGNLDLALILAGMLVMALIMAWQFGSRLKRMRRRVRNAVELVSVEAPGRQVCVGPLIDVYLHTDTVTSLAAAEKLICLLRFTSAGHSELLTSRHVDQLRRVLRGYHPELILSALSALERLGYATALPEVGRLTKCPEWFVRSGEIRRTARQCRNAIINREAERLLRKHF